MAIDRVSENIPSFLDGFLSKPSSSIPKGAQWIISFEEASERGSLVDAILPAITLAYKREPNASGKWNTEEAAKTILTPAYQGSRGCLFCQAIGLPGDAMNPVTEGSIKSNEFIRSYVGAGRDDFPIMRATFLDTHVSFVDSFLRGWALATANFGLLARPIGDDKNYRTNLVCHKFGITQKGPFIIQTMTFKDICCVGVSEEEYTYNHASAPVLREARFVYNSYTVDTVSRNSEEFLMNKRVERAIPINFPRFAPPIDTPINPTLSLTSKEKIAFTPNDLARQEILRSYAPTFPSVEKSFQSTSLFPKQVPPNANLPVSVPAKVDLTSRDRSNSIYEKSNVGNGGAAGGGAAGGGGGGGAYGEIKANRRSLKR